VRRRPQTPASCMSSLSPYGKLAISSTSPCAHRQRNGAQMLPLENISATELVRVTLSLSPCVASLTHACWAQATRQAPITKQAIQELRGCSAPLRLRAALLRRIDREERHPSMCRVLFDRRVCYCVPAARRRRTTDLRAKGSRTQTSTPGVAESTASRPATIKEPAFVRSHRPH
jgi:hypothetical protein